MAPLIKQYSTSGVEFLRLSVMIWQDASQIRHAVTIIQSFLEGGRPTTWRWTNFSNWYWEIVVRRWRIVTEFWSRRAIMNSTKCVHRDTRWITSAWQFRRWPGSLGHSFKASISQYELKRSIVREEFKNTCVSQHLQSRLSRNCQYYWILSCDIFVFEIQCIGLDSI